MMQTFLYHIFMALAPILIMLAVVIVSVGYVMNYVSHETEKQVKIYQEEKERIKNEENCILELAK